MSYINAITTKSQAGINGLPTEFNAATIPFERPADDLQALFDRYNHREPDHQYDIIDYFANNEDLRALDRFRHCTIESYFASIGDIEAMKVLIKYGVKVADHISQEGVWGEWDINTAMKASMTIGDIEKSKLYAMYQFLVDNGAVVSTFAWCEIAFTDYNDRLSQDMMEEKLSTLEYLLDHGTDVNQPANLFGGALDWAMQMKDENTEDRAYKDRIIQMLIDHGAKLVS